jgi:hypothetical protein
MEVRHHVVGVLQLDVDRRHRQDQAGEAAHGEHEDEAHREQHRRLEGHRARHMVAIQLKIFTAVGTAISIVAYMKNSWPVTGMPVVNMWCAQTMKLRMAMRLVAYTMEA